jgi:hypothetical protein
MADIPAKLRYEGTGAEPTYSVGGTLSGLGTGLTITLQNNGGDDKALTANGVYSMPTTTVSGSTYSITVSGQPTGMNCVITNGTGTFASSNIINANAYCYWTLTASAGTGCNVLFEGEVEVIGGTQHRLYFAADDGYSIASGSGTCGGFLSGNSYLTNAIIADCTVIANCSLLSPGEDGATMTINNGSSTFTIDDGSSTFSVD